MAKPRVAVLIESDFYEKEIFYYEHRFTEAGIEAHFLSRLWDHPSLTFTGHEHKYPFECTESFEGLDEEALRSYRALIVPSGIVADRLRWTPDLTRLPPACDLLRRAFAEKSVIKGIICHGLWLAAPIREVIAGRRLTCHNNLHADALAYGADYVDADLVEDDDLVTARTGAHCHLLAARIIERIGANA
jgi:protease I